MNELDDLAPEDFVAARDALAKRLKAEGKTAEAAEVKKQKKPTVQAWIAGQVLRHHADVVNALGEASREVAAAQEAVITTGDRERLRDATTARRQAVRDVGRAVKQVLARNGRPAHHKDDVLAALDAAITSEVAGGTFGLRDDLELPARAEPARDVEAERRASEAKAEISAAEARVNRARDELAKAESALAAVVERHRGVERDA